MVFLSHRSTDEIKARRIYLFLKEKDVPCYIDKMDDALKSIDDVTSLIITRVTECTHMMAIVSNYTETSWWVPFEIGVASRDDKRITTFKLTDTTLPHFLLTWPILKNDVDLEKFVALYKKDDLVPKVESKEYRMIKSADQFHNELKRLIG